MKRDIPLNLILFIKDTKGSHSIWLYRLCFNLLNMTWKFLFPLFCYVLLREYCYIALSGWNLLSRPDWPRTHRLPSLPPLPRLEVWATAPRPWNLFYAHFIPGIFLAMFEPWRFRKLRSHSEFEDTDLFFPGKKKLSLNSIYNILMYIYSLSSSLLYFPT